MNTRALEVLLLDLTVTQQRQRRSPSISTTGRFRHKSFKRTQLYTVQRTAQLNSHAFNCLLIYLRGGRVVDAKSVDDPSENGWKNVSLSRRELRFAGRRL